VIRLFLFLAFLGVAGSQRIAAAPISALAFSPDGSILASSGHQRVDLRSPEDAAVLNKIECEFPRVSSLLFANNDRLIVGGGVPGVTGVVTVVELKTKSAARSFGGYSDLVTSLAISPDGQWLAIGSADHSVVLEPLTHSTPGIRLVGHSGAVLAAVFSPSGDLVITASADRSIKTWNLKGELIRSFNQHTEIIHALALRPRAGPGPFECASGSDDHTVRIWQPAIGRMVRIIRGHGAPIFALSYDPSGTTLFSARKEGVIRRLDNDSDEILTMRAAHDDAIYSLTVSPDGQKLASGDWTGNVKIWHLGPQTLNRRN